MRSSARVRKSSATAGDTLDIRLAKEKDLRACAKILHTQEVAGANEWYPTAGVLRRCMGKYFLLAEQKGKILGCAVVEPLRHGVIGWWFAVAKEARGQGVGSALMAALERTAKRDGKYFFLVYSQSGSPAVAFYRKRGYEAGQDFTELIKQL